MAGGSKAKGEVTAKKLAVGEEFSTESKANLQELNVRGTAKVNGSGINEVKVGDSINTTELTTARFRVR